MTLVRHSAARALFAACALVLAGAAPASTTPVPLATIFAAYAAAGQTGDLHTLETQGVVRGTGLTGTFHTWRRGGDERDDETLGPRVETTLRRGARVWIRNPNGNVRELHGFLLRRARTADFIDSGDFLAAPDHATYLGSAPLDGAMAWRIAVNATDGEPETLWIDRATGLLVRTEYLDGDGPTFIDYQDYRTVEGHRIAFRSVTSDGNHAFDVTEETTSVAIDHPIDDLVFAPFPIRTVTAPQPVTVPLIETGAHVACNVMIGDTPLTLLVDTGAQNVLLDTLVAKRLGLAQEGQLEVRGANRMGGLRVARLPSLQIGAGSLDDLVISTLDLRSALGALHVDGILGYPFFAASLVELDFPNHRMRFGVPGSFEPRGEKIALDTDREIPEATLRVNDRLMAPFVIDTGNSGEMLFYRYFIDRHAGIVPLTSQSATNYGVGGANRTYHTMLDQLQIGSIDLYHRDVDVILATEGAFADRVDAGNVGLGLLRNFVVTFDISNAAMYVERGPQFDDGRRRTVTSP